MQEWKNKGLNKMVSINQMFNIKEDQKELIKESVNFKRSEIVNATNMLKKAMNTASNSNDKYQVLAATIFGAMWDPKKKNSSDEVWNFMKFFAQNASKGKGFRMNQEIEKAFEK